MGAISLKVVSQTSPSFASQSVVAGAAEPTPVPSEGGSGSNVAGTIAGIGAAIAAVGTFLKTLGGIIKSGTQHATWDQANVQAGALAQKIDDSVKNGAASGLYLQIGEAYRLKMIAYLTAATRWGEGYPQNKQMIIDGLKTFPNTDRRSKVYLTTWLWAMWAIQNTDVNRPDDWQGVAVYDLNQTLQPALTQYLGVAPSIYVSTGGQVTGTGTTTPPAVTPGTGLAGIFSGTSLIIVLVVAAILSFFFFKR